MSFFPQAHDRTNDQQPAPVRRISCGCCTNGCCCHNHMDIPRGLLPHKCDEHARQDAIAAECNRLVPYGC